MTTVPVTFQNGTALFVNVIGSVCAEVLNASTLAPIEPFTLKNCRGTGNTTDATKVVITWTTTSTLGSDGGGGSNGGISLAVLQNQPVRIRFQLSDGAQLFSFWVAATGEGLGGGYVGRGDPVWDGLRDAPRRTLAVLPSPSTSLTPSPSPSPTTGLKLELSVPELVGASQNASTHYWFPTNCAFSFNESYLLLDVRLADDCSDYYCNKTHTHKPSDPSHQILQSFDGGATFAPLYTVRGHSPWDRQTALKPFLGPCTIDVNATSRMVLYQGQIRAPWQVTASFFNLDDEGKLQMGLTRRLTRYHVAK